MLPEESIVWPTHHLLSLKNVIQERKQLIWWGGGGIIRRKKIYIIVVVDCAANLYVLLYCRKKLGVISSTPWSDNREQGSQLYSAAISFWGEAIIYVLYKPHFYSSNW